MSSVESKFCRECGRSIEKSAQLCPHCGRAQGTPQWTAPDQPAQPNTADPSANPNNPYGTPNYVNGGAMPGSSEERNLAMACHLASFSGYLIPFGNIIGPLIVWLVYRERFPFVDDQGKESLNFQITSMIAIFVAGVSFCIGIGVVLLPIVLVAEIILTIIAAVKASQGIAYRYPLTIRFIS